MASGRGAIISNKAVETMEEGKQKGKKPRSIDLILLLGH
jgi:hypothetical protein